MQQIDERNIGSACSFSKPFININMTTQTYTYSIQSTATINAMPSRGSPTDDSINVTVTMPPCGIPAAPAAAAVAVILQLYHLKTMINLVHMHDMFREQNVKMIRRGQ